MQNAEPLAGCRDELVYCYYRDNVSEVLPRICVFVGIKSRSWYMKCGR